MRIIIVLFIAATGLIAQDRNENPVELGKVIWLRDYDQAVQASQESGKPIFLLFQEVPGCANCTKYGRDILSHPHMVEIIETAFVPLAIYNNTSGKDRETLLQFREPSWNNPVVRIIDEDGQDLVERTGDFRSKALILSRVIDVLRKSGQDIPVYIDLLQQEWAAEENNIQEDYLSMYCFWTGEKEIAQIDGVIGTEAGYMHGREVVKISYDESKTDLAAISKQASKVRCADAVYTDSKVKTKLPTKKEGRYKKDRQDKYYLRHTEYQFIPLTELQKTKVNSAIGQKHDPQKYLSPRQLQMLTNLTKKQSLISEEFMSTWWKMAS